MVLCLIRDCNLEIFLSIWPCRLSSVFRSAQLPLCRAQRLHHRQDSKEELSSVSSKEVFHGRDEPRRWEVQICAAQTHRPRLTLTVKSYCEIIMIQFFYQVYSTSTLSIITLYSRRRSDSQPDSLQFCPVTWRDIWVSPAGFIKKENRYGKVGLAVVTGVPGDAESEDVCVSVFAYISVLIYLGPNVHSASTVRADLQLPARRNVLHDLKLQMNISSIIRQWSQPGKDIH